MYGGVAWFALNVTAFGLVPLPLSSATYSGAAHGAVNSDVILQPCHWKVGDGWPRKKPPSCVGARWLSPSGFFLAPAAAGAARAMAAAVAMAAGCASLTRSTYAR